MDTNKIIEELSANEKKVLVTLSELGGKASPQEVLAEGDFSQEVEVMNAASWLQSKKLVDVQEEIITVYILANEGEKFLQKGLPEKRALRLIIDNQGSAPISLLAKSLDKKEIPIAIGWLKQKGWARIQKENNETLLVVTDKGKSMLDEPDDDEQLLQFLHDHPNSELDKTKDQTLLSRKNVIKEKEIVTGFIQLTEAGKNIVKQGITLTDEISQITSAIIKNEAWKKTSIRPYDVHTFAPSIHGGKPHPLSMLIKKIRQMFLEMGFQEISGDFVESCFWNMDMLFIPQDHPAREMQDTFYCKIPEKKEVSDPDLVRKVASVHEDGGMTSSLGWKYSFSKEEGNKALLRTHTTVNTIRYLYEHPQPPSKIFSIGQVFRKENIDSTHLPIFYQIEGIIHEEGANFRQLKGLLAEIYKRMGFEKIRFRPAYFPYTEPSMEVEVFFNDKWMELGGSGIFRPEVTEPIGIKTPVLAWGLGLERLAMLLFDLHDMRRLYQSDFDWLKNQSFL